MQLIFNISYWCSLWWQNYFNKN